jgi:UDPglucose 6-dehydrogenase/GDP-mannose 6-dehydrogenase
LVTAACLAEKGLEVTCVDVDEARVAAIGRGEAPIHERGLEDLLRKHAGGRLRATTNLREAVLGSEVTLIAVGTPFGDGAIDLTAIRTVAAEIGRALGHQTDYHVVAVKSTVVPGTTDEVVAPLLESCSGKRAGRDFGVGVNPEFLTEGQAVDDFMNPDRIVVGGLDERTLDTLAGLYVGFGSVPVIRTNLRTAEMIKYASNALLATAISFSNEIANLCQAVGDIDVVDVMRGVHASNYLSPVVPGHGRVTAPISGFFWPGCGFGGSCLPKDVKALIARGSEVGSRLRVLDAVVKVNEEQFQQVFRLLGEHFATLANVRVTVLGLAFRPDTADMRESPAIPIITRLLQAGARVRAYDPAAVEEARRVFGGQRIEYCESLKTAVRDTDAIVLVTRWAEFDEVPMLLADVTVQPLVVDGRRMLDANGVDRYAGIGRSIRRGRGESR